MKLNQVIAVLVLILAFGWCSYEAGASSVRQKQAVAALEQTQVAQVIADKIEASQAVSVQQERIVYKTVWKERIKYVETNKNAGNRCLDDDFVGVYNTSIASITESPNGTHDASAPSTAVAKGND